MNRFINIGILLLLVLFISFRVNVACNELNSEQLTSEILPFEIPVTFIGTLPCTSCMGIENTLILEEDRYIDNNTYIAGEMEPIRIEGTWKFRSDTLYLYIDEILNYKTFFWDDNELIFLSSLGVRRGSSLAIKVD